MKRHYSLLQSMATAAAVVLTAAGTCLGAVLNVPQYNQEQDQWCWNASSQMVLAYAGYSYSQSTIAQWAVGGQNIPNYLYGSTEANKHGCDEILAHYGSIQSSGSAAVMSLSTLGNEIANGRPVIIRWGWDSGGGHILVLQGTDGSSVYVNDPWPANGQHVSSYDWVCRASDGHTWTHTLQLSGGSSPDDTYYQYYQYYLNLAQQCYSYAQSTGSYYYMAYAYYYYAYAMYYGYMYYGDSSSANAYYNYYMQYAQYYYDLYTTASYYYDQYEYYYSVAYYYYYYATSYLDLAYCYFYYAYAVWYYYMAYGYSDYANSYYNYYLDVAYYYYYLYYGYY